MEDADRETLRTNRTYLTKNIHNVDDIVNGLFNENVITEGMKQEIEAEKTRNGQIRKMLDILPRRGQEAFKKFMQVLIDTDNRTIAEHLRPGFSGASTKTSPLVSQPAEDLELPDDWPRKENCITSGFTVKRCEAVMEQLWKDESKVYSMRKFPRGRAIIINNEDFKNKAPDGKVMNLQLRKGTEKDSEALESLFKLLHFDVKTHKDQTVEEILTVLDEEKKLPIHESADCFVLVILTHGCREGLYGYDSTTVSLETIESRLDGQSWPQMKDKPKLLFIQACQGKTYDFGAVGANTNDGGNTTDTEAVFEKMNSLSFSEPINTGTETQRTPTACAAHFLIAQATTNDMVSFRNEDLGSWFIQAVVYIFRNFAHSTDINTMLTKVNNLVSKGRAKEPKTQRTSVAASEVKNRLLKDFYFFPGLKEDNVDIHHPTD